MQGNTIVYDTITVKREGALQLRRAAKPVGFQ